MKHYMNVYVCVCAICDMLIIGPSGGACFVSLSVPAFATILDSLVVICLTQFLVQHVTSAALFLL